MFDSINNKYNNNSGLFKIPFHLRKLALELLVIFKNIEKFKLFHYFKSRQTNF